jgi:hypothetical protein
MIRAKANEPVVILAKGEVLPGPAKESDRKVWPVIS